MEEFEKILKELKDTYVAKNHDYGNSVHDTFNKFGLISFVVRLNDKINRINTLCQGEKVKVSGEKIEDTLLDMANYAILAVVEMRKKVREEEKPVDFSKPIDFRTHGY